MITNPKDFFQQIQNLCEEVALKIKALGDSLSSFLTKSDAEATYLDKTEAANTYLGKSETATRATVADSATSADKATNDANGNNISNTYLKSATAQSTYLGKTDKAESAKTADSATKATQDGNGKNIATTYATVASLNTTNTNVTTAQTTANDAKALAEAKVGISGNRGQLAGYETSGTATTINADSPDSNQAGTNVTVANGSANTAWTKVVRLTATVTVTLGSAWQWAGGEAPEISTGGVVVLCWCGDGGVANFVSVIE